MVQGTHSLPPWEDIEGLSDDLNSMYREDWSLINWLASNYETANPEDFAAVLDMSIQVGRRIENANYMQ